MQQRPSTTLFEDSSGCRKPGATVPHGRSFATHVDGLPDAKIEPRYHLVLSDEGKRLLDNDPTAYSRQATMSTAC